MNEFNFHFTEPLYDCYFNTLEENTLGENFRKIDPFGIVAKSDS